MTTAAPSPERPSLSAAADPSVGDAAGTPPVLPGLADPAPTLIRCANCGVPLRGDWCGHCGQPVKGLVRHFSTILGDFFDSVFDLDSRTLKTLPKLFFRPGRLTLDYFAGRRVAYVSPVRLFLFLAIVAFFAMRLTIDVPDEAISSDLSDIVAPITVSGDGAPAPPTPIERPPPPAFGQQLGPDSTPAAEADRDRGPQGRRGRLIGFDWDPGKTPLVMEGLGDSGNAWLNLIAQRLVGNARRVNAEPQLMVDALLEHLPVAMFLMLPVFALLLKVAYLFKRRLYMEHLIVALHSHAFLSAALLVLALLSLLEEALPGGDWKAATSVPSALLLGWMPLYLLIMQKRVYRQGWPLTLLKFGCVGIAHSMLLSVVAIGVLAFSLATL